MGTVVAQASMSLDGYIAKADNSIGRLFDWYEAGDVEVPTATPGLTFHLTAASADYWRRWTADLGVIVCGRTLFDFTDGWGGRHTMDAPVVVVTHRVPTEWVQDHPDAPFEFVTDGVAAALARAQEIAGSRTVAVTAGTIAAQMPAARAARRRGHRSGARRHGRRSTVLPRSADRGRPAGRSGGVHPRVHGSPTYGCRSCGPTRADRRAPGAHRLTPRGEVSIWAPEAIQDQMDRRA